MDEGVCVGVGGGVCRGCTYEGNQSENMQVCKHQLKGSQLGAFCP